MRSLLQGLWNFTTKPTIFRQLIVDNESSEEAMNVRSMTEEQRVLFVEAMQAENLDASQQGAIEKALTSHLSVIHGPPGTGKTSSLVALLSLLDNDSFRFDADDERAKPSEKRRNQTVIMAPSNIAVDTVVARLVKQK